MSCRTEVQPPQSKSRRLALTLGASMATLAALAGASRALAATTVSGGSTAVATATVSSSGGADDITQTGTLNVASGPAVTLNSNNSVTNSGTIETQNASGLTGVLAQGGNSGSITNSGSIVFNQSSTLTTTSSNGVVTGPFATDSDLYGVRVIGSGTLTGDITNSGTITIQGADSAGISVEAPLSGSLANSGTVSVSGTDSYGIRTTAAVGGNVSITGSVAVAGQNAQAVSLGGDVGGGLVIGSSVTATGYHTTSRSTTAAVLAEENAGDILQGGSAVTVAGSLAKGLLISAPPATLSSTDTDLNGDGITDSSETTGSVISYGSAPAMVIGAAGRDITLGEVGTGDSAYGVVILGSVSGAGLRDGIAANGLQIGVDGGGAVNITSGVHVAGTLSAAAYGGDATALHLLSGASVPVLQVSGTTSATMTGDGTNAAQAIVVEQGGSLPTIKNGGTISATVVGAAGQATAILDKAGSLTRLENTGTISASLVQDTGSTATVTGTATAIDDQANTTGLSILSYQSSATTTAPSITGAIKLGSGGDSLDVEAGTMTGDISFGAGANALTINGGAAVAGALSADGGTLALSIGTGSLQINSANQINLTSLNLGAGSTLVLTADPAAGTATQLDVAGAATITDGAKLRLRITSIVSGSATYDLIRATSLTGAPDSSLLTATPFLYNATLATDASAGVVSLTLARKTAAQLQLDSSIAGAYDAVMAQASASSALSGGLLAATDRKGFTAAYDKLLPEHSGGVFQLVRSGVEAFGRPLDDRQGAEGGGAWIQEVNVGLTASDQNAVPGYKAWGVGLIAGFETPTTRLGAFGVTVGGFSGEVRPHDSDANDKTIANVAEVGGYWRATVGPVAVNARIAGDYLSATGRRVVDFTSDGETLIDATASGHWTGWGVTSRFRASYEARLTDSLYLRPQIGLDYLRLSEGAYTEGGGGVIDLAVDGRTTSELSGFAGLAAGALFGQDGANWGPELLLGWRDVASANGGTTTARFVSGGDSFTVGPLPISGSGPVARLALKSESNWGAVALEGGAEVRDGLTIYDLKLAAHIAF